MRKNQPALVSAILLAAGESKRMGRPKLLLPFGDSTVLGQTIDNLVSSRVDEVVVVLGAREQEVGCAVAARPVKVVYNPDFRNGMSTSLICGLKLVSHRAAWIMVALSDQPLVDTGTYNRLIEAAIGSEKGIVVPVYSSKRGNPIIISAAYRGELMSLDGDVGGREVVRDHPDDILEVAVSCQGVVININTIAEYRARLHQSIGKGDEYAQKGQA
jgi:molybdenum cofactor cytidylyltransferase